jgi:hypothetical protein
MTCQAVSTDFILKERGSNNICLVRNFPPRSMSDGPQKLSRSFAWIPHFQELLPSLRKDPIWIIRLISKEGNS